MRTILKFGGTSVATKAALDALVRIVAEVSGERAVVVSATAGTTDALVSAAEIARNGDGPGAERIARELEAKHRALVVDLFGRDELPAAMEAVRELSAITERTIELLHSVALLHELTARTRDAILSYGERVCAPVVAALLSARGVPATAVSAATVIATDGQFGNANPRLEETRTQALAVLAPLLVKGTVPVVTGFIGATGDGVITTLGRGASDYTAGILAAVLDADQCLIYTDVSGVMSADPRTVKDARPLPMLSYAEMAELAYFGAKILHPRAVLPALEKRIPVRILNTFAPADHGTTISGSAVLDGSVVKATTSLGGLGLVTVQGVGMSGVPGFAARVFDTCAAENVSVLMISQSSSENSICLVVPEDASGRLRTALELMFRAELQRHDVERVSVEAPVAIVAAVGEGMRGAPGVAGRVFGALGRAGVNVMAIAQGSSELNISLVVAERDRDGAVLAIHGEFHSGNDRPA